MAKHDALAQGPAFVRAAIEQGKNALVGGLEHGHVEAVGARHAARTQGRDVINVADGNPAGHGVS